MPKLTCDGERDCTAAVSHIDRKGWIYCTAHGRMMAAGRTVRKLTAAELAELEAGRPIPWDPAAKRRALEAGR